jgi:hypothetical protein
MNKKEKDSAQAIQMVPRGALRAVREHPEDLRNSERKVAQYLLEAPDKAVYQSTSELAENAGTSEPTVLRFSRALGFKGSRIHGFEGSRVYLFPLT